jgi:hypothetical protein
MVPAQVTSSFLEALFDILEANADVLSVWKIGLFTGNPALSVDTVLADLIQPTFTGYLLVSETPPALEVSPNGDRLITWPTALFQPSAPVSPTETVTGWFLQATISATPTLLMGGFLQTPKQFAVVTDALTVIAQTILPNSLVYGGLAAQV